jgi:hypothetical protein
MEGANLRYRLITIIDAVRVKIRTGDCQQVRISSPIRLSWIGHYTNPKYDSIFAQNVRNTSACFATRREYFRIASPGAGEVTEPEKFQSQSGKSFTGKKRKSEDYGIRQESWAGVKRRAITSHTNPTSMSMSDNAC